MPIDSPVARRRVLVIDTDPALRRFVCRLLSHMNLEPLPLDGAAALDSAAQDCVIVYNTEAGWEPLVDLRARCPQTPIILLLSPSMDTNSDLVDRVSPAATLSVPFKNKDFEHAIIVAFQ
jgi:DNA-binding response OmpR family regulator